jgi:hypothetical protein
VKIAILGSAPSSLLLHPAGDPSWQIWGCSPGVYPAVSRVDAWFELHRWEPGIIGKPQTQKPWFSPEYVQWMSKLQCTVWMAKQVPDIPTSQRLPIEELEAKYGNYFWTSSIAYMMACAIEDILAHRKEGKNDGTPDTIGLWGVDMAATEEYGYQRAGCQHFADLARMLGIEVYAPPESDLLRPMPHYGLDESEHWHIKAMARTNEFQTRIAAAQQAEQQARDQRLFLQGALENMRYMVDTWHPAEGGRGTSQKIIDEIPPALRAVKIEEVRTDFSNVPGPTSYEDEDLSFPPAKYNLAK